MVGEQQLKLDMDALEANMEHAEVELGEDLKPCRCRTRELEEEESRNAEQNGRAVSVELECVKKDCISFGDKLARLEIDKISIEDELQQYKSLVDELKEKFTCLQEDYKAVRQREERAQERVTNLENEIKRTEDETRDKYVQLKAENIELMLAKKRAEDKIETWKRMFVELESRVNRLEEDVPRVKGPSLSSSIMGPRDIINTISNIDKEKKDASNTSKSLEEANGEGNCASLVRPLVNNQKLNCDAGTDLHVNVGSPCPPGLSLDKESRDMHATGLSPPGVCMPHEPLFKAKEEESISSETELQHGLQVRRHLEFEQDGSTNKNMVESNAGSGRPLSAAVIEVVDSDDEIGGVNIIAVGTPSIRDKGKAPASVDKSLKGVSKDEKEITSEDRLKTLHANQRGDEHVRSSKKPYELTSTPKRKRASNVICSDSEGDNDEDKIPISKLKLKKLQDLPNEPTSSPVNLCSMPPIVSSEDRNVEESFTPRRRLVTLRQTEERKNALESISQGHLGRNETDTENQVMAGLAAEDTQDLEGEDVGSDTEGESLDAFIVDGSDDEDTTNESEDVGDDDMDYHQVISMIRREKKNKTGWKFEADMLSSFQKDPELCMKAVCTLYRQQTAEEKSLKGSLYTNNRGFSKFDAIRGTNLAEFLLDGDPRGELKKTVAELEKHMPRGLDECSKLASHYSKQLFRIYQNKEDPYFP